MSLVLKFVKIDIQAISHTCKQQSFCAKSFKSVEFYIKLNNILLISAERHNSTLNYLHTSELNNHYFLHFLIC
jgi:hypothetical protein